MPTAGLDFLPFQMEEILIYGRTSLQRTGMPQYKRLPQSQHTTKHRAFPLQVSLLSIGPEVKMASALDKCLEPERERGPMFRREASLSIGMETYH